MLAKKAHHWWEVMAPWFDQLAVGKKKPCHD
jgi:hypothetical protein